jgi:hypothetical protein
MTVKRDLSRYVVAEATREQIAQQWTAIDARLSRQRRPRWLPYSLLLAGTAAVIIVYLTRNRPIPERHWTSESAPRQFGLDDGSQLQLQPGSEVTMLDRGASAVHLQVLRGGARFDVRRDPTRRFEVSAAGIDVMVVGTAFTVALDGAEGKARVSVERGEVDVRPHQEARLLAHLHAGQSWPARATETERPAEATAAPAPATEPAAPQAEASVASVANIDRPQAARATSPRPATVDARAATPAVRSAKLDPRQLLEQANAARRSGDVAQAAAAFEALRSHYPGDSRAALASFELGRLRMGALDDLPGAVEALQHSIALAPHGVFREDAEACLATALARVRAPSRCENARRTYLQRYPKGTHAAEMSALDCGAKP